VSINHQFNGFRLVNIDADVILVTHDETLPANYCQGGRSLTIRREDMKEIAAFIRRNAIDNFAPKLFQFGEILVTVKLEDGVKMVDISREEWESRKPAFCFKVDDDSVGLMMLVAVLESSEQAVSK
jgi:hypothetical protein